MYDVFYTGPKPNLFPHEYKVDQVSDAVHYAKTKFFWYISGHNDYSNFDFHWMPDLWEQEQFHIFPDQHCRNSETYFVNKHCEENRIINYNSSQHVERVSSPDLWHVPEDVVKESIDLTGFF